jgi:hypothetical protein
MSTQYTAIARVGGTTAEGLTGFANSAKDARVSLDSLASISSAYGGDLAYAFGTVAGGVGQITKAAGAMDKGVKEELIARGIMLEEQLELTAAYSKITAMSGRREQMTTKQLADGTVKYINELDKLTRLTGMSRQEAEKFQQSQLAKVQVGVILGDLEEGQRNAINTFLGYIGKRAGPEFQAGLEQLMTGIVTEDAGRMLTWLGPELSDLMLAMRQPGAQVEQIANQLAKLIQDRAGQNSLMRKTEAGIGTALDAATGQLAVQARMFANAGTDYIDLKKEAEKGTQVTDKASQNLAGAHMEIAEMTAKLNESFLKTLPAASGVIKAASTTMHDAVVLFQESIDELLDKLGIAKSPEALAREAARETAAALGASGSGFLGMQPGNVSKNARASAMPSFAAPGIANPTSTLDPVTKKLGDIIAARESAPRPNQGFASSYDVPFDYGKHHMPPKPLTEMSINEALQFQREQIQATKGKLPNQPANVGTGALGKYQFNGGSLRDHAKALEAAGYDLNTTKFSPEIQDMMFKRHLGKDWENYLAGKQGPEKSLKFVAGQWEAFTNKPTRQAELLSALEPGFKTGGISTGPASGYSQLKATIAGPANQSPVAFDTLSRDLMQTTNKIETSLKLPELRELNQRMADQMGAMQQQISKLAEVVDILRQNNATSEKILQAARN